jgi:hypothetical protein
LLRHLQTATTILAVGGIAISAVACAISIPIALQQGFEFDSIGDLAGAQDNKS